MVPTAGDAPPGLTYLALGDSNVYGAPDDCGSCTTYPHLVQKKLARSAHATVTLLDGSQHNRLTASMLLDELKTDSWEEDRAAAQPVRVVGMTPRQAVSTADLITITVSANDIPWYQSPDSCAVSYDDDCLENVQRPVALALDGVLSEIAKIRSGRETTVLVTTFYNDLLKGPDYDPEEFFSREQVRRGHGQARAFLDVWNADLCQAAKNHQARCADTYRAINGSSGLRPLGAGYFSRDAGDLNQKGQDKFAQVIIGAGLAPRRLTP